MLRMRTGHAHRNVQQRFGEKRIFMPRIVIDTRALTYTEFILLEAAGEGWVDGAAPAALDINPGSYTFFQADGTPGSFIFQVTEQGTIDYPSIYDNILNGRGTARLAVSGHEVEIDGTSLSHDILPFIKGATNLSRHSAHKLHLAPADGYTFQPASGVLADFRFKLTLDGELNIDPRYGGFSSIKGRTLIISGYEIVIDIRKLSHGLRPLDMLGEPDALASGRATPFTYIPAQGYNFQPGSGVVADFKFTLDAGGELSIEPRYGGFSSINGRTLTISGYAVTLDTGGMAATLPLLDYTESVIPQEIAGVLIPATYYIYGENEAAPLLLKLDTYGHVDLENAPEGATVATGTRMCGVPDRVASDLQIRIYGPPGGRWRRTDLTFSIDANKVQGVEPVEAVRIISGAFSQWQEAGAPWLKLTPTSIGSNSDITVRFAGKDADPNLATALGTARYPEQGIILFNMGKIWNAELLQKLALHEIGHSLGLAHDSRPRTIMFATIDEYETPAEIDQSSRQGLHHLYRWKQQTPLTDRGTSDRPILAVAGHTGLTGSTYALHMIWKGPPGNDRFYESTLTGGTWSPERKIDGPVASTHSPALTEFTLSDGLSTRLLMAWKSDEDRKIYYAQQTGNGWGTPRLISGIGSTDRPALATYAGDIYMAWKGVEGDSQIWWTRAAVGPSIRLGETQQQSVRGVETSTGPTLVPAMGRLYMFWKGPGDKTQIYYSFISRLTDIWSPQEVVKFHETEVPGSVWREAGTSGTPAATAVGAPLQRIGDPPQRILLAWKGVEEETGIWVSVFDGERFAGQIRVDGGTSTGIAVREFNGTVFMAWRGAGGNNNIFWATLGGPDLAPG
ncbi:matrixin family metalloprotease [Streptomyces sp. NPDC060232]|uniref:matrixin family metalloprotease n=1 Tax=Streptomyces sp. NPDC060232 TaxID=3347079 RepID=UPI003650DA55